MNDGQEERTYCVLFSLEPVIKMMLFIISQKDGTFSPPKFFY